MRLQGTVVRWDAQRGCGLIRSPMAGADLFFRGRDVRAGNPAPAPGMAVEFEQIHVGGHGPRAMALSMLGPAAPTGKVGGRPAAAAGTLPPAAVGPAGAALARLGVLALMHLAVLAAAAAALGASVAWLWPWAGLNLAAFAAYAADKRAARARRRRLAEATLHALALAGGWAGAGLAQQWLRHKRRKPRFMRRYRATVALHWLVLLAALAALAWPRA